MELKQIETEEQFNEYLEKDRFLLIKHSLTCPVSGEAFDQYQKYIEEHSEVPTAYLAVQHARPLSNYIAETFNIKHESPQAILFEKGKPVWNESHWRITYDSLSEALQK
ncbi:bacillithiol system redox-active protein YtxJ [Bacillus massiliglaciei]|uniref:bacillithiol system redox-active protein YtxJ n=1 Tax=Bacillus massiliglaciei TaxID=1816693 RepID=UPI000AAACDC2|nr:bacillithiol system redox-active protein YtxJ [Bacillus massiliglaciei]